MNTASVALLVNAIVRHQQPQFAAAKKLLPGLQCLLSTDREPQRDYAAVFDSLDVTLQKTLTLRKTWKHRSGFADDLYVHIPYDTLAQLRRRKPTAILSFELGFRSLASAIYRRTHSNTSLTVLVNESEHTVSSWGLSRRMMRPWILKTADLVTYNGSSCRRYLDKMGVPQDRQKLMTYVAHPAMIHHGSTQRDFNERHRLLHVGQMTERKHILPFIQTLSRWCKLHPAQPVELTLVGRGVLQNAIESLRLPENLKLNFAGVVDPTELPKIYAQHGVLVFPTLADEWGLVTNEAMHSGLPVLGSVYAQANLDLIQDKINGWQFQSDDENSTLAGLDQVFRTSVDQLNLMAASARMSVEHRTPQWGGRLLAEATGLGDPKE